MIVAIDGTSGSGKTTTAKLVAEHFGWFYLDTGATYRAVAYEVLRQEKNPEDVEQVEEVLLDLHLRVENTKKGQITYVNGVDVSGELRKDRINEAVTPVSKIKKVREYLVNFQRKVLRKKNVIAEGRDIGSVVFPDADLKIYMDADIEERAIRRKKQVIEDVNVVKVKKDLKRRDYHDSKRRESPLIKTRDALVLNTTDLSIKEQVNWVVDRIKELNERKSSL